MAVNMWRCVTAVPGFRKPYRHVLVRPRNPGTEEGSGLGLPIVKGLVELHGGTFTLKSKLREGTEVIVIFPPERVMDTLPATKERKRRARSESVKFPRRAGRNYPETPD
jgi:Histidine kinase-, DNA gyrase B-, and HSP90-like ATPase